MLTAAMVDAVLAFQVAIQAKFKDSQRGNCEIGASFGKRYARLWCAQSATRSTIGFIDLTNGDLLKAARWKAPAKGVRGNIVRSAPARCASG